MSRKQKQLRNRILLAAALLIPGLLLRKHWDLGSAALLIGAWMLCGWEVMGDALKKLAARRPFDEAFLMTVASGCAVLLGEFSEAASVMVFYQIGELFQSIAVERSRKSVAELMDLRPDAAYILRDGQEVEADPEEVQIGDLLRVHPGERIPVDGVVIEGSASVDTSKITGEATPQDAAPGDTVLSGGINLSGVLTIRAESAYASSTVARILELMESAGEGRSHTETLVNRFARYYTPCVVYGALALALLPPLFTGFSFSVWIHRALNFLVVSCPCALVISVPLAFFGGMGAVSRAGMIAKGGLSMEHLAGSRTVFFDKTGTLTTGCFRVVRQESSRTDFLELLAGAESVSGHPLARAIVQAAGEAPPPTQVREIPGEGIEAQVRGHWVQAGNRRMLGRLGLEAPEPEGATVVYAVIDGDYAGYVVLEDTIKENAPQELEKLRRLGITRLGILTGDRPEAAGKVGEALGLSDVRAGLLPQEKLEAVRELMETDPNLAFVGDGVNDAPVLMAAGVGIAMGGVGSDAAVEASDLVLLRDDLGGIARAISISRKTLSIARQNIAFALVIKFGVMALSIPGHANMWMAVFADVGVALLCILNSMRTMHWKN